LAADSHGPVQAIANDPGNAELYAARAQTRLKLENYLDAIEDASKALDLNPRLAKAHQRKGCAAAHRVAARCAAASERPAVQKHCGSHSAVLLHCGSHSDVLFPAFVWSVQPRGNRSI